jgi:endonuclease III
MNNLPLTKPAAQLAAYIRRLDDFAFVERGEPYSHMGATITDAILQAGMRYEAQVRPRVQRLIATYPEANTSSAFAQLLAEQTPFVVVGINGRKAIWVQQMTAFLIAHGIETEVQLSTWLVDITHERELFGLKGVGLKTVNYLKLLVGITDGVAVDTHVRAFVTSAGIVPDTDREVGRIVAEAARLLHISPGQLDASIWWYRVRLASRKHRVGTFERRNEPDVEQN